MTDVQQVPLDPRRVECVLCSGKLEAHRRKLRFRKPCGRCNGTGTLPLHPTPVVEVLRFQQSHPTNGTTELRFTARYIDADGNPQVVGGDTVPEALQAARLAALGARLAQGYGASYAVLQERDDSRPWLLATGPTAEAAIEAAFAAKDADAD